MLKGSGKEFTVPGNEAEVRSLEGTRVEDDSRIMSAKNELTNFYGSWD